MKALAQMTVVILRFETPRPLEKHLHAVLELVFPVSLHFFNCEALFIVPATDSFTTSFICGLIQAGALFAAFDTPFQMT